MGVFLFNTVSRLALGPSQTPIQWVPGALTLGIRHPGCETEPSPLSSAEIKNAWSYTFTPLIHLHGVVLNYAQTTVCLPFLPASLNCADISVQYLALLFERLHVQIPACRPAIFTGVLRFLVVFIGSSGKCWANILMWVMAASFHIHPSSSFTIIVIQYYITSENDKRCC